MRLAGGTKARKVEIPSHVVTVCHVRLWRGRSVFLGVLVKVKVGVKLKDETRTWLPIIHSGRQGGALIKGGSGRVPNGSFFSPSACERRLDAENEFRLRRHKWEKNQKSPLEFFGADEGRNSSSILRLPKIDPTFISRRNRSPESFFSLCLPAPFLLFGIFWVSLLRPSTIGIPVRASPAVLASRTRSSTSPNARRSTALAPNPQTSQHDLHDPHPA